MRPSASKSCGFEDHVEISGEAPERAYGPNPVNWQIRVPASVNLDLVTFAGTIRVANTEGALTAPHNRRVGCRR